MSEQTAAIDIKKMVLATGIRVGTQVKTKFMKPFITKASPEGLYMLDLDITLEKIKTAAKFINRLGADNLIVCSGRQYAEMPIEKFCEALDSAYEAGKTSTKEEFRIWFGSGE